MTPQEITNGIIVWIYFFVLYILRKIPPFTKIWKYTMLFLAVLVGTVWYNNWKERNK